MNRIFSHKRIAVGVVAIVPALALAMGSRPKSVDDEAANLRIQPVAKVKLAAPVTQAAAGNRSGEELYKTVCGACHETGAAGAPKTGDKAAWAPRIAQGFEALLNSVTTGKNAMPPRAGSNATDEELARAVTFLANKGGANFQ